MVELRNKTYELLAQLRDVDKLAVSIMIASGRRAVDIGRIHKEGVQKVGGRWFVTLAKDKVNSLPVNFSFNFEDSLIDEPEMTNRLNRELELNTKPFEKVNWQRIRKKADFRLHSLRNRKAIKLILQGLSGLFFQKM